MTALRIVSAYLGRRRRLLRDQAAAFPIPATIYPRPGIERALRQAAIQLGSTDNRDEFQQPRSAVFDPTLLYSLGSLNFQTDTSLLPFDASEARFIQGNEYLHPLAYLVRLPRVV